MDTTNLLNLFAFILSVILNSLHVKIVYNCKHKLNAVILSRVLPPGFIIMASVIAYSLDLYRVINLGKITTSSLFMFNTVEEKLEVVLIGTYLGMNLMGSITKFRSYKMAGRASILMKKKSVIVPVCIVVLMSLVVTLMPCFYNALHGGASSLTFAFASELTLYHAGGIIPTVTVYIMLAYHALQYYQVSGNMFSQTSERIPPQLKQLRRIVTYIILYFTVFILCWLPFLIFRILTFQSINLPISQTYKSLSTCAKLIMFALNPIANGMLMAGERQKIINLFGTLFHFLTCKVTRCRSYHKTHNRRLDEQETYVDQERDTTMVQTYNSRIPEDDNFNKNIENIIIESHDAVSPEVSEEVVGVNLCIRRLQCPLQEVHSFDSSFDNPEFSGQSTRCSSEKPLFTCNNMPVNTTEEVKLNISDLLDGMDRSIQSLQCPLQEQKSFDLSFDYLRCNDLTRQSSSEKYLSACHDLTSIPIEEVNHKIPDEFVGMNRSVRRLKRPLLEQHSFDSLYGYPESNDIREKCSSEKQLFTCYNMSPITSIKVKHIAKPKIPVENVGITRVRRLQRQLQEQHSFDSVFDYQECGSITGQSSSDSFLYC